MYMCLVAQSCPTLRDPMDCSSPGSSVHRDSLDKNTRAWVACSPPGDLPNPGSKPRSPALQADFLLSEPPGKSMNTGVGSLSLLQGNFLTQELNQGLLHCRWICYQLSYPGSLENTIEEDKGKCSPGRLCPFCWAKDFECVDFYF